VEFRSDEITAALEEADHNGGTAIGLVSSYRPTVKFTRISDIEVLYRMGFELTQRAQYFMPSILGKMGYFYLNISHAPEVLDAIIRSTASGSTDWLSDAASTFEIWCDGKHTTTRELNGRNC